MTVTAKDGRVELADFRMASFMVARDVKMVDSRREGKRMFFIFADNEATKKAMHDFRYGDDTISARKFIQAQANLRSMIFDDPV